MNKLFKLSLLSFLLGGCVGENVANNSSVPGAQLAKVKSASLSADSNRPIFTVGGTYDSMSQHPSTTKSCLKIGDDMNFIKLSDQKATLDFSSTIDEIALQSALGREYTATFGWGPFAVTKSYQYAKSSQDDDFSLNMNYAYQYSGRAAFIPGALIQGNAALSPEALNLVTSDPVGFRTMCGDSFVAELDAGVSVLMRVSLKFHSHNEKNAFDASFNGTAGLANVLNIIESNSSGIKYSLSLAGIQVGGDPEALNALFASHGGTIGSDGYPVLTCSSGGANPDPNCMDMINQVLLYATNVVTQLKTIDDYNLSNPTSEPWEALGVFPGMVNPDSATLAAMQDISIQYNNDQASQNFINNYYQMLSAFKLLSPSMNTDLVSLINQYKQVMAIYANPANMLENCYDGYVSSQCIVIRDNLFKQRSSILNDQRLNQLLSYLQSNQYTTELLISNSSEPIKTECALSPISDSSLKQYLINCNGQISGSLISKLATTISHDSVLNVINVHNLNYSYTSADYGALMFNYLTTQPLAPDTYYANAWKNTFTVLIDGQQKQSNSLSLVNDYH